MLKQLHGNQKQMVETIDQLNYLMRKFFVNLLLHSLFNVKIFLIFVFCLKVKLLTLFRIEGRGGGGGGGGGGEKEKDPPTSSSPVTSRNVGISPKNFLTFSLTLLLH